MKQSNIRKMEGVMAPYIINDINTDMLFPKQYLQTLSRSGLGQYLFANLRDSKEKNNFILNDFRYKNAKFLLAGENFGCGSSREHAVWALLDYGIQAVIAPSFAEIFYDNCFKNGLLPAIIKKCDLTKLESINGKAIRIDLDQQIITCEEITCEFQIEGYLKELLINRKDPIEETQIYEKDIANFETLQIIQYPWIQTRNPIKAAKLS